MKKLLFLVAILGSALVLFSGNPASAWDTSPYLFGTWDAGVFSSGADPITDTTVTALNIVNPNSANIAVCCCTYYWSGTLHECRNYNLAIGGSTVFSLEDGAGNYKCIAMPEGKWTFDANVVIGGLQENIETIGAISPFDPGAKFFTKSRTNMGAVVINSKTLPEFTRVMQDCRNTPP
jgi:hypothetical protein